MVKLLNVHYVKNGKLRFCEVDITFFNNSVPYFKIYAGEQREDGKIVFFRTCKEDGFRVSLRDGRDALWRTKRSDRQSTESC